MENKRINEALGSAYERIRINGATMETKDLTALLKEIAALEKVKVEEYSAEADVKENEKKLDSESAAKKEELRLKERELDIRLAKDTSEETMRANEIALKSTELDIRREELKLREKELDVQKRKDIVNVGVKILDCVGTVAASAIGVCGTLIGIKAIMAYENNGELFASAAKMLLPKIKV